MTLVYDPRKGMYAKKAKLLHNKCCMCSIFVQYNYS